MQPRPVHPVNERSELRCAQSHHAVADRRPPERSVLQPFPEQHQAGPVPGQNLQSGPPVSSGKRTSSPRTDPAEMLAHQRGKTVGPSPEVDRLGRHQHPHRPPEPRSSRRGSSPRAAPVGKVAASSQAEPEPSQPRSRSRSPTSPADGRRPIGSAPAHDRAVSTTTGANAIRLSPARIPPLRTARRQPNNCCGVSPCRRATALTVSPSRMSRRRSAPSAPPSSGGGARPGEHFHPPHRRRLASHLRFVQKLSVRHVSNPLNSGEDNRRSGQTEEGGE